MGIERFFSTLNNLTDIWLEVKYPPKEKRLVKYLFIDFNSIIHTEMNNIEMSEDIDKYESRLLKSVEGYIIELLNFFSLVELKYIMIAIDGVPTLGKVREQQKRRYLGELINRNLGMDGWSKNNISPTTRFMSKMNNLLNSKRFLDRLYNMIPSLEEIRISDSREEGEGEMKILRCLREKSFEKGNIVIFSPDSDMVLLNLIVKKEYNVSLLRLDQVLSSKEEKVYNYLEMSNMRVYLYDYCVKMSGKSINEKNLINDIIFLFSLFGNDFLPKIESINPRVDFFIMIDIYLINLIENGYLTKKGGIISNNLKYLFYHLGEMEKRLERIIKRRDMYMNFESVVFNNFPLILNDLRRGFIKFELLDENFSYVLLRLIDKSNILYGKYDKLYKKYKNLFIYFLSEKELYELLEYNYNEKGDFPVLSNVGYIRRPKDIRMELKKRDYKSESEYHKRKLLKLEGVKKKRYLMENYLDEYYDILSPYKKKRVITSKVVSEYLYGIEWVYQYYFNNRESSWYYKYNYSPSLGDLFKYFSVVRYKSDNLRLLPLEHSLLITPIDKSDIRKSLDSLEGLIDKKLLDRIEEYIKESDILPDINEIYMDIFKRNKRLIDCSISIFLSKCNLLVLDEIDNKKFINDFREVVSIREQLDVLEIREFSCNFERKNEGI